MADELKDQRIPIMMSPSEVKAIDDWMFSSRIKSRSEAIRRLCQVGLAASDNIEKAHRSSRVISDAISQFVENNSKSKFDDLNQLEKLKILKDILYVVVTNSEHPNRLIRNVFDILHIYKNVDLPEELGFQDRNTILEAIGYLRSKHMNEDDSEA